MPRGQKYFCTVCMEVTPKLDLTVKRVVFQSMGEGHIQERSRVVAWLCVRCKNTDPDYNRKPNQQPTKAIHE